jgi:hypothetical protein
MILADREKLWPRLEKLGERRVREMLAANQIEVHEVDEVREWLALRAAVGAITDAHITKWMAIVVAVAAVVAAVASVWALFK